MIGLARFSGGYYLAIESEDVNGVFLGSIVAVDEYYTVMQTNYVDFAFESDNKGIEGTNITSVLCSLTPRRSRRG